MERSCTKHLITNLFIWTNTNPVLTWPAIAKELHTFWNCGAIFILCDIYIYVYIPWNHTPVRRTSVDGICKTITCKTGTVIAPWKTGDLVLKQTWNSFLLHKDALCQLWFTLGHWLYWEVIFSSELTVFIAMRLTGDQNFQQFQDEALKGSS